MYTFVKLQDVPRVLKHLRIYMYSAHVKYLHCAFVNVKVEKHVLCM